MALGEHIRARRQERGLTAAALARMARISRAHLSEIERGHVANPSSAVLQRLAESLETTTASLLGVTEATRGDNLPRSLLEYARLARIPPEDLAMLAGIRYRGTQPARIDDWRYLHESIRRSMTHLRTDSASGDTNGDDAAEPVGPE